MGEAVRTPGGGGKLIKVNLGNIGCWNGGGSINVKSKLPDIYQKLTSDNFFIEPAHAQVNYGVYQLPAAANHTWSFSKSYNPDTGILSMGKMGGTIYYGHLHGGLDTCTAYAVYVK